MYDPPESNVPTSLGSEGSRWSTFGMGRHEVWGEGNRRKKKRTKDSEIMKIELSNNGNYVTIIEDATELWDDDTEIEMTVDQFREMVAQVEYKLAQEKV